MNGDCGSVRSWRSRRCTHQWILPDCACAGRAQPAVMLPAEESGYYRADTPNMADRGVPRGPADVESTVELLNRARAGDASALDALFSRCLPPLRRWARGRLPLGARGALDTQDLVQDTVLNALQRLDHFESRHEGALQAYLRQAVLNRIRDEARKLARRPAPSELDDEQPSPGCVAAGHRRRPRGRRTVRSRAAAAPARSIARPSSAGLSCSTTTRSWRCF